MNKLSSVVAVIVIAVVAVVAIAVMVARRPSRPSVEAHQPVAKAVATPSASVAPTSFTQPIITSLPPRSHPPDPAVSAAKAKMFESFKLRPFEVATKNGANAWTKEDGMAPDVIRQLAHNEWEVERMTAENSRIKRRQLVYRSETVPMLLQRAGNQPLQSFTLPAMDGQEVEVEVIGTPVVNGLSGSVMGRVKGYPDSMVSVGFSNGNESFNVISPENRLFLAADAREPGEVMVKEIDPNDYSPPAGEAPDYILTNDAVPGKKAPSAPPATSPQ